MGMKSVPGTVYVAHFIDPNTGQSARYEHAGHYIGWTAFDLETRLDQHRRGQGSPLIKAALDSGLDFVIARTWEGVDRHFERQLKNRGSACRICPRCREEKGLVAMLNIQAFHYD